MTTTKPFYCPACNSKKGTFYVTVNRSYEYEQDGHGRPLGSSTDNEDFPEGGSVIHKDCLKEFQPTREMLDAFWENS